MISPYYQFFFLFSSHKILLEIATKALETVNRPQKEATNPSSQMNNRKKVHTGKEQNTPTPALTKTASFEYSSKAPQNQPQNQPQHPNSLAPKPMVSQAPQMGTVQRPGAPRTQAHQANFLKENRSESLGTFQKTRETSNPASTWRKETVNVNVEEAMRNKMKYLPHVLLKEVKYGNHFVPVLPSFLIRDN